MKRTNLKAVPDVTPKADEPEAYKPDHSLISFTDWLTRAMTHPDTPETLRTSLGMIVGNIFTNESGYDWTSDEEGLRFMLPRLLFHMSDDYALGLIHTTGELVNAALPREVHKQIGSKYSVKGGE